MSLMLSEETHEKLEATATCITFNRHFQLSVINLNVWYLNIDPLSSGPYEVPLISTYKQNFGIFMCF